MQAIPCICDEAGHRPRLVVITGGPGAGKTALLETVRYHFCQHVSVLPESASLIYGGGFLDKDDKTKFRPGFSVPADADFLHNYTRTTSSPRPAPTTPVSWPDMPPSSIYALRAVGTGTTTRTPCASSRPKRRRL